MFVLYDVIDISNLPKLRFRKVLRFSFRGKLRFVRLTPWLPCKIQPAVKLKRQTRHHCDFCEKYQGWRD